MIWVVAVLIIVLVGLGWYVTNPLPANDGSIATVAADDQVSIEHYNAVYALEPTHDEPKAGLVFYPGAHVSPDAYLASLAPLAVRADIAVYIPRMPLGFAVFDPGRADGIVASHPEIDHWFVGGHSLGGAMACRYASDHRDQVSGLILFAAYCEAGIRPNVSTLSVTGSADTVLNPETYTARRENLPANATVIEIPGMNHTAFGSYTGQRGDEPSPIGYRTAHDRLASVVVPWVQNRTDQLSRRHARPPESRSVGRISV